MNKTQADALTKLIRSFAENHEDLRALAACGSWVRGNPRPDSDLDLLIIAHDPQHWRQSQQWLFDLPFASAGLRYDRHEAATYGTAWSMHITLQPSAELELSFAPESWALTDPIDGGTKRVVGDAFRIEIDKDGALQRLLNAYRALGSH